MYSRIFIFFLFSIGSIYSFGQADTIRKTSDTIIIKKAPVVIEKKYYEPGNPVSLKNWFVETSASYLLKDLSSGSLNYSDVNIYSLSLGRKLSKWSVSAGLAYSRGKQSYNEHHTLSYQEEKVITLKDTFDIWYTINKDGDTLTHYTIVEKDTLIQVWKNRDSISSHTIKVSIFSIPLSFNYSFQWNNWNVRPGITLYPTIKKTYLTSGEGSSGKLKVFNMPAKIHLAMGREVMKGLYPEARLGIMSNILSPDSGHYLIWLNAGLALRYEFN